MAIWDDVIPKEELERFAAGGMGTNLVGFGEKPVLLVVDMSYAFVDSSFPLGDSSVGWAAVHHIQKLQQVAREKRIPILYSTSEWKNTVVERGLWKRTPEVSKALQNPEAYRIVTELTPRGDEPVVIKTAPSAFHGTDLLRMLIQFNADTLILVGMVTSGCVYATAVDGFSFGFRVIIPAEGVADRSLIGHKVALFNFHMKYGDVLPMDEVLRYMSSK
jgi:isochorismate hydrolase